MSGESKIAFMKNERILHADDQQIIREGIKRMIEAYGNEDGHQLVGSVASINEVESLLEGGLRPTVALVDNKFPHAGDGERAAEIIKKVSSETIVVSLSTDSGVTWGDYNITKDFDSEQIMKFLTNLPHKSET